MDRTVRGLVAAVYKVFGSWQQALEAAGLNAEEFCAQLREYHQVYERQLALADRARQFGFQHVLVIDRDVGCPCGAPDDRPGFAQLLSEISQGHVGAVVAFETTRLVRHREE
jgi:hypothetical protein